MTVHANEWAGRRLLVLYRVIPTAARTTVVDHVEAFRRYSGAQCVYLNLATHPIPAWIRKARFDGVILHTTLLSARWAPPIFERLAAELGFLADWDAVKIALPQDEFIHTEILCDFLRTVGVGHVFSVAPESEWPKIYGALGRSTRLNRVLTGYLEPSTLRRIDRLSKRAPQRTIDIGYRAYGQRFSLGRHGHMKILLAQEVERRTAGRTLSVDVSTRAEDTFLGDDWYRFLLRCRYTVGIEGGASVLDARGEIRGRTEAYLSAHPGASFDEVRTACFPDEDGSLALFALSPRHLEACATRTCQILVEGEYNGILRPEEHYIPLRADLSNLDEVLDGLGDEGRRARIAERAHRDVVESGEYTYVSFVSFVLQRALPGHREQAGISSRVAGRMVVLRGRLEESLPRGTGTKAMRWARQAARRLFRLTPAPLRPFVRRAAKVLVRTARGVRSCRGRD